MKRILLAPAALAAVVAAACSTGPPTFTRNCYEVPTAIAETRGDTLVTTTGLRYIVVSTGSGDEAAICTDVSISYEASLTDGTTFETGVVSFVPGAAQVIPGVEQGVVGMRETGERRVIIPPALGYGSEPQVDPSTGAVVIPANSTLIFDVEVLTVTR